MVHAYMRNRSELKILAGPPDNFKMHSLNGRASTPIFNHLGSSSWHSYDAAMIVTLGKSKSWVTPVLLMGGVVVAFLIIMRIKRRRSAQGISISAA